MLHIYSIVLVILIWIERIGRVSNHNFIILDPRLFPAENDQLELLLFNSFSCMSTNMDSFFGKFADNNSFGGRLADNIDPI